MVLIEGEPASGPSGPGAPPPLSEHVQLPTRIDTRSAVAQVGRRNVRELSRGQLRLAAWWRGTRADLMLVYPKFYPPADPPPCS